MSVLYTNKLAFTINYLIPIRFTILAIFYLTSIFQNWSLLTTCLEPAPCGYYWRSALLVSAVNLIYLTTCQSNLVMYTLYNLLLSSLLHISGGLWSVTCSVKWKSPLHHWHFIFTNLHTRMQHRQRFSTKGVVYENLHGEWQMERTEDRMRTYVQIN